MNAAAPSDPSGRIPTSFPPLDVGPLQVLSAAMSYQGKRPYNEDRLGRADRSDGVFWALADGLGGHKGGARASELAVQAALQSAGRSSAPRLEDRLKQAVSDAHAVIRAEQKIHPGFADMRSTLVLLGLTAGDMAWSHCGDSRLYHLRSGRFLTRTRDHSAVQMLVAAGEVAEEDIPRHPGRSRLVSCLGSNNTLLISARSSGAAPVAGDAFLLCSDGVWEHLTVAVLEGLVAQAAGPEALLTALDAYITAAQHPEQDNYSAISVFVTAR
ncbi:MAG TPA: PP2C family serine/threonine-protein phosphatase [Gammaproteobacteria bacterium]|nr:PP2C family serine/threonine-protein phosphatase [Gammaproteobacteria bacterium]